MEEEDDLLAGVDESLFDQDDVLNEQDAEDFNLDGFGFVEEEAEGDDDELAGFGF